MEDILRFKELTPETLIDEEEMNKFKKIKKNFKQIVWIKMKKNIAK